MDTTKTENTDINNNDRALSVSAEEEMVTPPESPLPPTPTNEPESPTITPADAVVNSPAISDMVIETLIESPCSTEAIISNHKELRAKVVKSDQKILKRLIADVDTKKSLVCQLNSQTAKTRKFQNYTAKARTEVKQYKEKCELLQMQLEKALALNDEHSLKIETVQTENVSLKVELVEAKEAADRLEVENSELLEIAEEARVKVIDIADDGIKVDDGVLQFAFKALKQQLDQKNGEYLASQETLQKVRKIGTSNKSKLEAEREKNQASVKSEAALKAENAKLKLDLKKSQQALTRSRSEPKEVIKIDSAREEQLEREIDYLKDDLEAYFDRYGELDSHYSGDSDHTSVTGTTIHSEQYEVESPGTMKRHLDESLDDYMKRHRSDSPGTPSTSSSDFQHAHNKNNFNNANNRGQNRRGRYLKRGRGNYRGRGRGTKN